MANLDRIIDCQIILNTTGITEEGFSTLLVCGVSTKLTDLVTSVTDVDELTELGFESTDPIYKAVSAAFSQTPRPSVVKVGKLTETTTGEGEEAVTSIDMSTCMTAICNVDNDFYGVAITDRTTENVMNMAEWCEAHTKLFVVGVSDSAVLDASSTTDVASQLMAKNYYRTAVWYHSDSTEFVECAVAARCFAITPGGETWANKKLSGVTVDSLTETQYTTLKNKNVNTFEKFRNVSITQIGKVVGDEWIDVIRFRDWLVEEISVECFSAIINSDKLPYTDGGIAVIHNILNSVLRQGQANGGIAPTEYDEDGNQNLGYKITVPLASSISANTKASRKLSGVKFVARLAGAIHAVTINGSLTYENLIA